jgi:hypothetical protein
VIHEVITVYEHVPEGDYLAMVTDADSGSGIMLDEAFDGLAELFRSCARSLA